jgi:large subunit ribosomal protein L14
MIHVSTLVQVVDNSGATLIRCIRLLRGSKRTRASVGNYIVGSVQKISSVKVSKQGKNKKTVAVGDVVKALIICSSSPLVRFGSITVKADKNSVILVSDNFSPLASRVVGPAFLELRKAKQIKILSIADVAI